MNTYKIIIARQIYQTYHVQAENEENAKIDALSGQSYPNSEETESSDVVMCINITE